MTIEETIENLVCEKRTERVEPRALPHDVTFGEAGLNIVEIYECIVAVEDRYGISIDEADGPAAAWSVSTLAQHVRKKLYQKSHQAITWKDSFETLIFNGQTPTLRAPLVVHLDITFRCNARCIFCYDSSGTGGGVPEMTTQEIESVIDECIDIDVVQITFGGGEAFIREDFMEILRHAKKRNLRIYILSNGTLITQQKARELARCMDPRFDMVQISLDAPRPDVHDKQRGVKGTFEKTMAGIRNLREVGIMPVINTVLTQVNCEYIPEMLSFLVDNGLNSFRLLRLHPLGRGRDINFFNRLRLTPEQSESMFEFLEGKRRELIGALHITDDNACIFPMSARAIRNRIAPRPGRTPASYACGAGTSMVSIGPDGSVFPCSYMYEFPELRIGSIKENSLKELWDMDELWELYRKPIEPSGKCRKCDYLYSCKTGCRILSYAVCGDMGAPDPGCSYQPGSDLTRLEGIGDMSGEQTLPVENLRNTLCY